MKTGLTEVFGVTKQESAWDQLVGTIENSFNKQLKQSYSDKSIVKVFYTQNYGGVAIVTTFSGKIYLDKLAVLPRFRGLGLGKALLARIFEEFPKIVWRASYNNPHVTFYYRHCDGLIKSDRWIVFWKNYTLDEIRKTVGPILDKPSDFAED